MLSDEEREQIAVTVWRWHWYFRKIDEWSQQRQEWFDWCAQWGLDPR